SWRRIQVFKISARREFGGRAAQKGVRVGLQKSLDPLPGALFLGRSSKEFLCFKQSGAAFERLEPVRKSVCKPSAQFRPSCCRATLKRGFHERAIRELIHMAAPVFYPSEFCDYACVVGNLHLRDQNGVVAKGGQYDLIDFITAACDRFS